MDDFDNDFLDNNAGNDPFDEFGIDSPSSNRKPTSKIADNASDALRSGTPVVAKGVGKHILASMPDMEILADDVGGGLDEGSKILDNIKKDLDSTKLTAKKATAFALPKIKKYLPKKLYDKLDEASKIEPAAARTKTKTAEEKEQDRVTDLIDNLFSKQLSLTAAEMQHRFVKDDANATTDQLRHESTYNVLASISDKMSYGNKFIGGVQQSWMRKMLELKYMHLFIAREHLSVQKVATESANKKLDAIVKNTALPEFVKSRGTEYAKFSLRGKTLEPGISKISGYVNKAVKGYTNSVSAVIQELMGGIDAGIDAAKMAEEMGDMGPADSKGTKAGKAAGGPLGAILGKYLVDPARPLTSKLNMAARDVSSMISSGKRSVRDKFVSSDNIGLQAIGGAIEVEQPHLALGNNLLSDGDKSSVFDNITRASIVEVIPKWLSIIAKNTRDIFTGEESELQQYDIVDRKITTISKARDNVMSHFLGDKESRSAGIFLAAGAIKGAIERTDRVEDEVFGVNRDDIIKVIDNAIAYGLFISGNDIAKFKSQTDPERITGNVKLLLTGIKDPIGMIDILYNLLFDTDGRLDRDTQSLINRGIQSEQLKSSLKGGLSEFLENTGMRSSFSDDIQRGSFTAEAMSKGRMDFAKEGMDARVETFSTSFKQERETLAAAEKQGQEGFINQKMPNFVHEGATKLANRNVWLISSLARLFEQAEGMEVTDADIYEATDGLAGKKGSGKTSVSKEKVEAIVKATIAKAKDVELTTAKEAIDATLSEVGDRAKSIKSNISKPEIKLSDGVEEALSGIPTVLKELPVMLSDAIGKLDIGGKSEYKVDPSTAKTLSELCSYHDTFKEFMVNNQEGHLLLLDALLALDRGPVDASDGDPSKAVPRKRGDKVMQIIRGGGKIYRDTYVGAFNFAKKIPPMIGTSVSALARAGGAIGSAGLGMIGDAYKSSFGFAGKLVDKLGVRGGKGKRTKIKKKDFVDVYRKNEVEIGNPLVSAKVQRKFGLLRSGERLKASVEIIEPMVHSQTGDVLVSQEDIDHGLVDYEGTPLAKVSSAKRKRGGAKDGDGKMAGLLGKGLDFLTGGANIYSTALKGLFAGGKNLMDMFGSKSKAKRYESITSRLDTIIEKMTSQYALLEDRLVAQMKRKSGDADGDGDRDGSYADQMQKRTARTQSKNRYVGGGVMGKGKPDDGDTGALRDDDDATPANFGGMTLGQKLLYGGSTALGLAKGAVNFGKNVKANGWRAATGATKLGAKAGGLAARFGGLAKYAGVAGRAAPWLAAGMGVVGGAKGLAMDKEARGEMWDEFRNKSFLGKAGAITNPYMLAKYAGGGLRAGGEKLVGGIKKLAKYSPFGMASKARELLARKMGLDENEDGEPLSFMDKAKKLARFTPAGMAFNATKKIGSGMVALGGKLKGGISSYFEGEKGEKLSMLEKAKKLANFTPAGLALGATKKLYGAFRKKDKVVQEAEMPDVLNEHIIRLKDAGIDNASIAEVQRAVDRGELRYAKGRADELINEKDKFADWENKAGAKNAPLAMPAASARETQLKQEVAKYKAESEDVTSNNEVFEKMLEQSAITNRILESLGINMGKVATNTGELDGIKKGLDANLKEATKPTTVQQIMPTQPVRQQAVSQPVISAAKERSPSYG